MLSESAQSIANGNYSDIIPDSKQDDEIGRLQDNFQHMQQSLSVHIRDLEQMTATLKERGEVLRKEYERTQKADKMKNTFLHNMTNQMAEPANAISNDVETLCNANMHMDRQQAESLTSNILHQGKVITELLNNLLNMSQDK
jgi:methyl-accepting chemotaxis protein